MLKKIWIKGFRNLKEVTLSFEYDQNFFFLGGNNQGKTNFLESLFFLGNAHSPFESILSNLIHFDENEAFIGADFVHKNASNRLYFKLTKDGQRFVFFNNKSLKIYKNLKTLINIDFISADIIRVFQDYSDQRRMVLDRFCAAYFTEYQALFRKYEKAVKQKNVLLKSNPTRDQVKIWNNQLINMSDEIFTFRLRALEEVECVLKELVFRVFPDLVGEFKLGYVAKGIDYINVTDYSLVLSKRLNDGYEKECRAGYSLYGPHRDDFEVVVNGKSLFTFYSRGVNRTLSILFKLACLILLDKKYDNFPILLLDDSFAEIDFGVKKKLVEVIEEKARFFYCSTIEDDKLLFRDVRMFKVIQGNILDALS